MHACDCAVSSLYRILFINNSEQDEKLITCCTADNVFKGSSWKYLLQSIVDSRVLQESGLAIHINDAAVFYITLWKDRDLETTWRDFCMRDQTIYFSQTSPVAYSSLHLNSPSLSSIYIKAFAAVACSPEMSGTYLFDIRLQYWFLPPSPFCTPEAKFANPRHLAN